MQPEYLEEEMERLSDMPERALNRASFMLPIEKLVSKAALTVDVDRCQVIEICNWQVRKFALTLSSIFYWISFINWGAIKDAIAKATAPLELRIADLESQIEALKAGRYGSDAR